MTSGYRRILPSFRAERIHPLREPLVIAGFSVLHDHAASHSGGGNRLDGRAAAVCGASRIVSNHAGFRTPVAGTVASEEGHAALDGKLDERLPRRQLDLGATVGGDEHESMRER